MLILRGLAENPLKRHMAKEQRKIMQMINKLTGNSVTWKNTKCCSFYQKLMLECHFLKTAVLIIPLFEQTYLENKVAREVHRKDEECI